MSRRARGPAASAGRRFVARPDPIDFRDRMFEPTLVEVPVRREPRLHARLRVPVLDQGTEGACTGFALATVIHTLLRARAGSPDRTQVSPWMLYHLARRYDEWQGEDYDGSSARGALKAWFKHGACEARLWAKGSQAVVRDPVARDAALRPLGAYYRLNPRDLAAIHCALAEVGILFATATVHGGWDAVDPRTGDIPYDRTALGAHAFCLVGYDEEGLWLQNSWGPRWGRKGLGRIRYADWLEHAMDLWVARLGAPVKLDARPGDGAAVARPAGSISAASLLDLRPHVIVLGNDGRPADREILGKNPAEIREALTYDLEAATRGWKRRRILVYAHGGLVDKDAALQRLEEYRRPLLRREIYPLGFVWKTDLWTTLTNILKDALRRGPSQGFVEGAKDFLLDRLDDSLEVALRLLGKPVWDEMKENARRASRPGTGGVALVAELLDAALGRRPGTELHLVAHSAGSILLAGLAQRLATAGPITAGMALGDGPGPVAGFGRRIETCTLWAPAITLAEFDRSYRPLIEAGSLGRTAVFTLRDRDERGDHCARIYNKSLLYLVSHAFETALRLPWQAEGEPLLGMERFRPRVADLEGPPGPPGTRRFEWVLARSGAAPGVMDASNARGHGDFDDDPDTVAATVARILAAPGVAFRATGDGGPVADEFHFARSAAGLRSRRRSLPVGGG